MCGKRKASKPVQARRKQQATPALRSATWQRIYITPSETPTAARGEPLNRLFYLSLPHGGVRISLFAVLAFAAALAADCSVFTVLIFAAAFVHELGHLICLKTNGVNIYGITVLPFGAVIRSDAEKLTYRKEAQAALAGPFAGLCAAAVSGVLFFVFRDPYTLFFAAANLTLSFVNLRSVGVFPYAVRKSRKLCGKCFLRCVCVSHLCFSRTFGVHRLQLFAGHFLCVSVYFRLWQKKCIKSKKYHAAFTYSWYTKLYLLYKTKDRYL